MAINSPFPDDEVLFVSSTPEPEPDEAPPTTAPLFVTYGKIIRTEE
jgi:hypothetical protein